MPPRFAGSGFLGRQLGSLGGLQSTDLSRLALGASGGMSPQELGSSLGASFGDTGLSSSLLPGQNEFGGLSKEMWFGNDGAGKPIKESGASLGGGGYGASTGSQLGGSGSVGSLGGEFAVLDQYDALFQQAANQTGVPVNLLKAIAATERGWEGTSVAGAVGIMQVMPFWGSDFGLDLNDPAQNILAGAKVLASNYQQYGDWDMAIRGYLGFGQDAYGTTDQAYLQRVRQFESQLNQSGGSFGGQQPINGQWGGNPVGNSFVQAAMQYVGVDYNWGVIPGAGQNPWETGWDCCLVGETRIYGPTCIKRIDEIQAGDVVWSFQDGNIVASPVTKAWQSKKQTVYEVRTRGRSVVASGNHPFLVARSEGRCTNARATFQWIRLEELKRGDQLVSFEHGLFSDIMDAPHADIAWLLGLILGDGNVGDRHLNLCVYGENAARASVILAKLTGNTPLLDKKHGITISCREFCDDLRRWGFDRPAHDKRVPDVVWRWPNEGKRQFLDGYCAADGHKPRLIRHGERSYASSSRDLVEDVRAIHLAFGDMVGIISTNWRIKPITIKGRIVKDAKPLHSFSVYAYGGRYVPYATTKSVREAIADGDGRWMVRKVLSVKEIGERDTWDIEVSGTGNFVANGLVVHNSGFTYFMNQKYGDKSLPMGSHYQYQYAQQTGQLFTDLNQLQPGDLVFIDTGWQGGAGAELNRAGHVAIYIGNGQIIHAANPSQGTIISPLSGYGGIMGAMHQSTSGGGGFSPQQTGGFAGNSALTLLQRIRGY